MARTYKSVGYTKRHFEQFAWVLALLQIKEGLDQLTIEAFKTELIAMFEKDNRQFDTDRFLDAVRERTEQLNNGRHYNL